LKSISGIFYDQSWSKFKIFNFLRNQKDSSYENQYTRYQIISLAKADIRFFNLLIELGWNKDQLNKVPTLPFEIKK